MTKSQPGLYELLRQRSLRSQMSHVQTPRSEPTAPEEPPARQMPPTYREPDPVRRTLDSEPRESDESPESVFEAPAPASDSAIDAEERRELPWYRGSVTVSMPVGIAISLLAAVVVFAGYQLGFSRGRAAEAPALWSASGGAEREAAAPPGTIVAVQAAAFEDVEQAFRYARLLNESGRFVETAQVVEPAAGGPSEVMLGRFASRSEAERSGLLERIRELEVQEGEQSQKPFGKAQLKVYSLGD